MQNLQGNAEGQASSYACPSIHCEAPSFRSALSHTASSKNSFPVPDYPGEVLQAEQTHPPANSLRTPWIWFFRMYLEGTRPASKWPSKKHTLQGFFQLKFSLKKNQGLQARATLNTKTLKNQGTPSGPAREFISLKNQVPQVARASVKEL